MASRRSPPGVHSHGSAKDLAAVGVGYTGSGTSEHTRQSAHGSNTKMSGYVANKAPAWTRTETLAEKIAAQRTALTKLKCNLSVEQNPDRRAKLQKNIGIKTGFIANLLKGLSSEHQPSASATGSAQRRAEPGQVSEDKITTLPGEDEADWH